MFRRKRCISVVGTFDPNYRLCKEPKKNDGGKQEASETQGSPEDQKDQGLRFRAACKAIGQALAEAGHPILVCVADWGPYAEYGQDKVVPASFPAAEFVIEGAEKARRKSEITLYRPLEPPPDCVEDSVLGCAAELKKVKLTEKCTPWKPETFPSVKEAEAIILISGGKKQALVASVAHHVEGEPVVAIPAFGGAAECLYTDLLRAHYEELAKEDNKLQESLHVLEESWDKDTRGAGNKNLEQAQKIIHLTEQMCRKSEWRRDSNRRRWTWLAGVCVFLSLCWVLLFTWLSAEGQEVASTPMPTVTATLASTTTPTDDRAGAASTLTPTPTATSIPTPTPPGGIGIGPRLLAFLKTIGTWFSKVVPEIGKFLYREVILRIGEFLYREVLLWIPGLLAAVLGLFLRTIIAYRTDKTVKLDVLLLLVDSGIAITLTLAFAILYVFGMWTSEGRVKLPEFNETTALFLAVLSMIGLAVGLLLPIEEFSKRIRQSIGGSDRSA